MTPSFLYFDFGNVLVNFDHHLAARQMAEVAGITAEQVWRVVFEQGLNDRYESGAIGDREFYDEFSRATDTRADFDRLREAGSDIFTPNYSIYPVVGHLDSAGYRLGVLSNTCPAHWNYSSRKFGLLRRAFDVYALSYELRARKPDVVIYRRAAELAGVPPEQIFFVDDVAGHVDGARQAGFDAVQYVGTRQLVDDLRSRGLRFNY